MSDKNETTEVEDIGKRFDALIQANDLTSEEKRELVAKVLAILDAEDGKD